MEIWQVICAFSIPSMLLSALITLIVKCINSCKALRLGVQAILRSQMITMFEEYSTKGYAPVHVRDNFQNVWTQYHSLYVNGVMDDLHDKFMALPIK